MQPYSQSIKQVESALTTNIYTGLTPEEVKLRQKKYGLNKLPEAKRESILIIFLRQFQSPLIYILLLAATIIFFIGERLDAFIISGILFFNAILGTIQEGRARNILEGLKRYIKTETIVLRSGKKEIIPASEIVIGDILILQEGERVAADARLFEAHDLKIDEAILTGESIAVEKNMEQLRENVPVGDQLCMAFRGTNVLAGTGQAIVTAIGAATEIGKLGKQVEEIQEDLPLKKKLDRLSNWILVFIFAQTLILFIVGILTGRSAPELIVFLTALFICIVPEGLPVVLTLALVSGARAMARKKVLIKKLQAVEGLGLTDVILIDKTGTLTRNELIVDTIFAHDRFYTITGRGYHIEGNILENGKVVNALTNEVLKNIGIAGILLNKAELSIDKQTQLFDIKGEPIDAALYVYGSKIGLSITELANKYKKVFEIPFDSQRMLKAGFYIHNNELLALVTGAPESIFTRCKNNQAAAHNALDTFLNQGLRVIAAAEKRVPIDQVPKNADESYYNSFIENNLNLLGLLGIQDAIRQDIDKIVKQARKAGLHIIMATGDHKQTALYVAKKVGIYKEGDTIIEGSELNQLSDDQLVNQLPNTTVFARVSPDQKLRIVQLIRNQRQIVAMTGDGVNDVPSILAADLGIAMGRIGTEVAKEASDMILLDDSFASIIAAIKEGRHIFFTLRRVTLYFFTTNLGEVLIVLFALFLNLPLPLFASQILWLNFVTDGFLDVSLVAEPHEGDILYRKLSSGQQLINWHIGFKILIMSIPMALGSIGVFMYYYKTDLILARTMTLLTMAMFQWFNVWNCRSESKSIFELGLFSNMWLVAATTFVFLLQIAVTYLSFMQYIFHTVPLSLEQWLVVIALSSTIIIFEELRIFIKYKILKREPTY